ncbi:MAG: hypothetical protein V4654_10295 [Bdellovibrionota bacterium]
MFQNGIVKTSIISLFLISSVAFAQPEIIKSPERVQEYVAATKKALKLAGIRFCKREDGRLVELARLLNVAQVVVITEKEGAQPVLSFGLETDGRYARVVNTHLSTDYKSITQVDIKVMVLATHNTGNLKNPILVDGWDVGQDLSCSNKY